VSTRLQRRQAIAGAIATAFTSTTQGAPKVYADPFKDLLMNETPGGLCFALARGMRTAEPSEEMGAIHQNLVEEWLVYFLIPRTDSTADTEVQADAIFELLQTTLAPSGGWKPATDAAPLELQSESVLDRDAVGGTIYFAIYANDYWAG
jgi:hypothetical protein